MALSLEAIVCQASDEGANLQRTKMFRKCILVILFLAVQFFAQYCSAADLELSIAVRRMYDGDMDKMTYIKPPGNKIEVYQRPLPFYLIVENTSNSSQKLWESG